MKKFLTILIAVLVLALFTEEYTLNGILGYILSEESEAIAQEVTVNYVVDGDTFSINNNGVDERVRLIGIDTPETKNVEVPELYGSEASDYAKLKLLVGETVYLVYDKDKRDKYDRLLAYVYLSKSDVGYIERSFNAMLLERGFARVMNVEPNTKYSSVFQKLQEVAAASGVGMWADSHD